MTEYEKMVKGLIYNPGDEKNNERATKVSG